MEKKFYVVQERTVGRFSVLTLKGFQPRGNNVPPLELNEDLASSLARTFTVETGRKCWIEEGKQYTVSRVVTWGPDPIETLTDSGDFEDLRNSTNTELRYNLSDAITLVDALNKIAEPYTYEYFYSVI